MTKKDRIELLEDRVDELEKQLQKLLNHKPQEVIHPPPMYVLKMVKPKKEWEEDE